MSSILEVGLESHTRLQGVAISCHYKSAMTPQLLNAEQYNLTSSHRSGNLYKLAWKPQRRFRSHTTQRRAVCSHMSVLEAPRMDPRSWPDGEPQDEMSLFLPLMAGREEVLTTIKSAQNMRSK
jgi:hypothetical protein